MKIVLLKGPGNIVLDDVSVPKITDDEVLVEVKWCGICGSDVGSYRTSDLIQAGTYLGHEFSGILVKVGSNATGWKIGDRVVCNELYECGKCYACEHGFPSVCIHALEEEIGCRPGIENAGGFAKYVRVAHPEYRLFRLPSELTFEEGTLIEPLACSLHAIRLSIFKPRDKVMVLGCGMIGLGVIAHLRNSGAGLIIATRGSNKKRGGMGLRLGADYVFNSGETPDLKKKVFELTDGHGIDVIFDCSGRSEAFLSAPTFLRPRGQIILVGNLTHEIPFVPLPFTLSEYSLQGSCCYYHDEFPMAMDFLKRRISPITDVITSKIRLSEIAEKGFERIIKSDSGEIKIIVQPDE